MAKLITLESVDSTNDYAKRLFQSEEVTSPVAIVSDVQTKGRGQKDRVWVSNDTGGLYFTLAGPPNHLQFKDLSDLSMRVGQHVCQVIGTLTDTQATLEWPNDILVDQKKCGGILIETITQSEHLLPRAIIIGIGLNINQADFPEPLRPVAISLRQKTNTVYNKQDFIDRLIKELEPCL